MGEQDPSINKTQIQKLMDEARQGLDELSDEDVTRKWLSVRDEIAELCDAVGSGRETGPTALDDKNHPLRVNDFVLGEELEKRGIYGSEDDIRKNIEP